VVARAFVGLGRNRDASDPPDIVAPAASKL
jgi:hypothetical protein